MSYIGEMRGLERKLKQTTDEKEREEIEHEIRCLESLIRMEDKRDRDEKFESEVEE